MEIRYLDAFVSVALTISVALIPYVLSKNTRVYLTGMG